MIEKEKNNKKQLLEQGQDNIALKVAILGGSTTKEI